MGSACWELFCLEHKINPDGKMMTNKPSEGEDTDFMAFFTEIKEKKYAPRSLFIDLEPTVVDEVRTGKYKDLFNSNYLLSGKEDAGGNYFRASGSLGRTMLFEGLEKIRKMAEDCSGLQGFMIMSSVGGGTGSGLVSCKSEELPREYEKKPNVAFQMYPSPRLSTNTLECFNAVYATEISENHNDAVIVMDNEALYNICDKHLQVEEPSYTNINRLIAQVFSSVTSSMRFGGSMNIDLNDLTTNLVPYPDLNYLLASYAPFCPVEKTYHQQPSVDEIARSVFSKGSALAKCDLSDGRYLACSLMYRGDVTPTEVTEAIVNLRKTDFVKFVDYVSTGIQVGINTLPLTTVPDCELARMMRSVCMLSNTNAVSQVFSRIADSFDQMFDRNAFVHWLRNEGFRTKELRIGRRNFEYLLKRYRDCFNDSEVAI